jgi:23S rRNA-/tRNA-specific pseudouridylate synthase
LQTPIFGDTKYGFAKEDALAFSPALKKIEISHTIFLHAGELHLPITPGEKTVTKFTAKMKSQMERVLDHLHIPKEYYIAE